MVGIGDYIQASLTCSLIESSPKNGFASVLNLLSRKGAENIVFLCHIFPQAILPAGGRDPQTSHILQWVFQAAFTFHLMLYHISLLSFSCSIFPHFQLFRKLLISLGNIKDFPPTVVFALKKEWKVNNCLKPCDVTL